MRLHKSYRLVVMENSVSWRIQRVEKDVKDILSQFLITKLRNHFKNIVTINHVRITRDLKQARIYVSTFGSDEDVANNLEKIKEYRGKFQKELSLKLKAKFCPKIVFFEDQSVAESYRIQSLLSELSQDKRDESNAE